MSWMCAPQGRGLQIVLSRHSPCHTRIKEVGLGLGRYCSPRHTPLYARSKGSEYVETKIQSALDDTAGNGPGRHHRRVIRH